MTFGEKLQQIRKASGLSQEQLAQQLDVSRQSISKWELNDAVPDVNKLIILSELFSVSIDDLLMDEQQSKENNKAKNSTTLAVISKRNLAHKQIVMGFITVVIGLIMLVLEYMYLPIFGTMQKAQVNAQGFYSDFIKYAKVQPMPTIFAITVIIIILGVLFTIKGCIDKRNASNS